VSPLTPVYIAVVGPGDGASDDAIDDAAVVGRAIAARGWILLCLHLTHDGESRHEMQADGSQSQENCLSLQSQRREARQ